MASEAQTEAMREVVARLAAVWSLAQHARSISGTLSTIIARAETDTVTAGLVDTVGGFPFGESLEEVQARVDAWATNLLAECSRLESVRNGIVSESVASA